MQKLMVTLLVGIIALAPAIAAAQSSTGSGSSGSSSSGSSTPSTSKGTTGSGSTSSGAPAASPSGSMADMSKYTTKADCEKAGGKWQASSKMCMKK